MSRKLRSGFLCSLILLVFAAYALWLCGWMGGPDRVLKALQTAAPGTTSAPTPKTTSVYALQILFGSIQSGDINTVSALTGGAGATTGIVSWGETDLSSFTGHTVFSPLRYRVLADDGANADIIVTGSMVFRDPAGDPGNGSVDVFDIAGEAKLVVKSGNWIVTSLPNYAFRGCNPPSEGKSAARRAAVNAARNTVIPFIGREP